MRPILLPLIVWLLIVTAIMFGWQEGQEDYSTGGSALLRPELHRMSEP